MVSRLALYIPEHLNAKFAVCPSSNSLVEVYTQWAFQIQNISPELKIDWAKLDDKIPRHKSILEKEYFVVKFLLLQNSFHCRPRVEFQIWYVGILDVILWCVLSWSLLYQLYNLI